MAESTPELLEAVRQACERLAQLGADLESQAESASLPASERTRLRRLREAVGRAERLFGSVTLRLRDDGIADGLAPADLALAADDGLEHVDQALGPGEGLWWDEAVRSRLEADLRSTRAAITRVVGRLHGT